MTKIIRQRQIEFASVKLGFAVCYTLCHASLYCRMAHLRFDRHPTSSNLFTAIVQSVITYALPSFAVVTTNPGSINALFRKALKRGLCQTSLEIYELIDTATNDCSVIYLEKPTVHIIFFHRNATSVLLPPSELEVITYPSRTRTSIFIKILLLIVVCSSFFNSPSSTAPSPSHFTPSLAYITLTFLKASQIFFCAVCCYMCFVLCIHILIACLYFFTACWTLHYIVMSNMQ